MDTTLLRKLARRERRKALSDAITGSERDRYVYAIKRVADRAYMELAVFGTTMLTPADYSRALSWYQRLNRIAERWRRSGSCTLHERIG